MEEEITWFTAENGLERKNINVQNGRDKAIDISNLHFSYNENDESRDKDLPEGYNTKVAAGGTNLSGGQRQRISIARALMKEAPIVLMDEPSSALDTYSENAVLEAMSVFMKKKTVIMVSHRMTGAEKFNRVVRMD